MIGWLGHHPKGLGIFLAALWLSAWVAQTWFGWWEYAAETVQHGSDPLWTEYLNIWLRATMENWQSEFLQLFTFVVATTYLIYAGSHESRDGQDRLEAKVDAIRGEIEAVKMAVWSTNTRLDEARGTDDQ
jgi:hypothetical protein